MVAQPDVAVSVVIPARNVARVLPEQLAALAGQDFDGGWEVIVADNGSSDGTPELVTAAATSFPVPLRLVDASRAPGANVARNDGARAARGAAILFCDGDDVVGAQWVGAMARGLRSAAIVGGPLGFDRLNDLKAKAWAFTVPSAIQEYRGFRYALSANLGVRAPVLDQLHGFDERFRLGFDEVDFGYRAAKAGFVVEDVPDALVHYRLRGTLRELMRQRYRYGVASRQFLDLYPELHDPDVDPLGAQLGSALRHVVRIGLRAFGPRRERDRLVAGLAYDLGGVAALIAGRSPRRRARTTT